MASLWLLAYTGLQPTLLE